MKIEDLQSSIKAHELIMKQRNSKKVTKQSLQIKIGQNKEDDEG